MFLLVPCAFWLVATSGVFYSASTLGPWKVLLSVNWDNNYYYLYFLSLIVICCPWFLLPLIPEILCPFFHKPAVMLLPKSIHPSSFQACAASACVPLNTDSLCTGKPPVYTYSPKFIPLRFSPGKEAGSSLKDERYHESLPASNTHRSQKTKLVPHSALPRGKDAA